MQNCQMRSPNSIDYRGCGPSGAGPETQDSSDNSGKSCEKGVRAAWDPSPRHASGFC